MPLQQLMSCCAIAILLSACSSGGGSDSQQVDPTETTATAGQTTGGPVIGDTTTGGTTTGDTTTAGTGTTSGGSGIGGGGSTTEGTTTDGTTSGVTGIGGSTTGGSDTGGTDTGGTSTGGGLDSLFGNYVTPRGVEQCSVDDIKMRVDFDMRDYYIYYDQVPQLNLADFETPEELIRDLRVDPDIFSFVTDAASQNDLIEQGRSGGFGFWISRAPDGTLRIRDIDVGSPANDAGVLRGDELLAVDGISVEDITSEQAGIAFDPDNAPVDLTIQTGEQAPRVASVDFDDFFWQTAGPASRYSSSDGSLPVVGYLPISAFLSTTANEIDRALQNLEANGGFDELVVDLRYNGGGLSSVNRRVASIVGGAAVENQVFVIREFNDKYSEFNETEFFDTVEEPLSLPRVFVLVTEFSASASEVFINALRPYIEVVVIGGVTSGKPFSQLAMDYCGKSINAMLLLRTNAVGVSVAGGIQPDCPVADEWETEATSVDDPLLGGALNYLVTGGECPAVLVSNTQRSSTAKGFEYRAPKPQVPDYR